VLRIKNIFVKTLFVTSVLSCALAQGQATRTACTGVFVANKVGHDCKENTCSNKIQGACGSCVDLAVSLPQGSEVVAARCYTVAWYPNDYAHGDLHEIPCTKDNSWSIFDDPVVDSSGNSVRVSTTYHNRSGDRDRDAKLCVDWR
jgi:hypothetical protein